MEIVNMNDSSNVTMSICQNLPSTLESLMAFIEICSHNSSEFKSIFIDEWLKDHQDIDPHVLIIIVCFYVLMITCGIIENSLVVLIIVRNKLFKSPRNMLILNLAISDLILCGITQPFNLVRFLTSHKDWAYGSFSCKFSAIFSGTNIFISTISITVIAMDRFQLIIHPTKSNMQQVTTLKAFFFMWLTSIILASPMVYFTNIESFVQPITKAVINRCTEYDPNLAMRKIKLAYSIMSVVIQYIVPLFTVITIYTRIFFKIRKRMVNKANNVHICLNKSEVLHEEEAASRIVMNVRKRKQVIEQKRQRRTNIVLFCIALIFALSWLPVNIMNLIMDVMLFSPVNRQSNSFQSVSSRSVKTIQAVCLLVVLCSACTNPVLYSWLNVSFKEKITNAICCCHYRANIDKSQNGNGCFKKSMQTLQSITYNPKLITQRSATVPLNNNINNQFEIHLKVDDNE